MRSAGCLLLATLVWGCGRESVKTYAVPKSTPTSAPPASSALPPGHPDIGSPMPGGPPGMGALPQPRLTWKTPAGWAEAPPGAMRVGSFKIEGGDGKQADVSIIPLGGAAGGEAANVNRWRGQVGLEPVAADAVPQLAQAVEVAGQPAALYELSGKNPGSGDPLGILAAIAQHDGTAWFFKMTGDPGVIAQQKPAFVAFLKSVQFEAGTAADSPPDQLAMEKRSLPAGHPDVSPIPLLPEASPAGPAENTRPTWQVPQGWTEVQGGQFLVAKFNLSAGGDAQASVNVSASAGDGGGLAANVNRWRKQLGLPEQPADEVGKAVTPLDLASGKAALVELSGTDARSGQPARLVGALVAQGGQTWFYKLMGDAPAVQAQKDAFLRFVQTAKY
jgi:hypothetical protein